MNEIIGYFLKTMISSSYSLKKKSILVDKPWALIDNDGEIQKLIFKKDNGLILSKNGKVTEGSWEYYPEARALLINRGKDKLLLNEQFIDNNVLILKIDGTDNEFFTLVNENTIPDYNVPKYLNSLKCERLKIHEMSLLGGELLQIVGGNKARELSELRGKPVELMNHKYQNIAISDGSYISKSRKYTLYVKNQRVMEVEKNVLKKFKDQEYEIENGALYERYGDLNKKISLHGKQIADTRLEDESGFIYVIKESKIYKILFIKKYELSSGGHIYIEQQRYDSISKGDKITTVYAVEYKPHGSYKIKGRLFKIRVRNNIIV